MDEVRQICWELENMGRGNVVLRQGTACAKAQGNYADLEKLEVEGDGYGDWSGCGQQEAATHTLGSHQSYAKDAKEPLKHLGRGAGQLTLGQCGGWSWSSAWKLLQLSRQEVVESRVWGQNPRDS